MTFFRLKIIFLLLLFFIPLCLDALSSSVGKPFVPLAHTQKINMIDTDKHIIITASQDSNIKVWDLKLKKLIKTFYKHKSAIRYIKIIPKTDFIISVDTNQQLYLWNLKTKKVIKEYKLPSFNTDEITLIPNTLFLFITGQKSIFFNVLNGKSYDETFSFDGYYGMSKFVKTDKFGKKILLDSGNYPNKKLNIYDINGTKIQSISYFDELCSADLSSDAKYIAGFFSNKTIQIYDAKTSKLLKTIKTDQDCSFDTLRFSPSSKSIALASGFNIKIWDINSSKKTYDFYNLETIRENAFSFVDEDSYVVGFMDGEVMYVDLKNKQKFDFSAYGGVISKVAFSDNGKKIYASNNQNHTNNMQEKKYFSILNYKTKQESKLFYDSSAEIVTAPYLSENYFFAGKSGGFFDIWDIKKRIKIKEKKVCDKSINYIDVSSDEKIVAMVTNLGQISVLDRKSLKSIFKYNLNEEFSRGLKFSDDGKYLLYISTHSFKVWDTTKWVLKIDKKIESNSSLDIEFKDNNKLVIFENPNTIIEYDIETKNKKAILNVKTILQKYKLWSEYDYIKYYKFSNNAQKLLINIKGKSFLIDIKLQKALEIKTPFKTDSFLSKLFYFNFDDTLLGCVDKSKLYLWSTKTSKLVYKYNLYKFDSDSYAILSSQPYHDIEVSFSIAKPLVVSTIPKTYFPPFSADSIDIWDIKESRIIQKLSVSRYTSHINDFALDGNKILYGASMELSLMDNEKNIINKQGYKKLSKEITLRGSGYVDIKKVAILKDKYMVMMDDKIIFIDKKSLKILNTIKPLHGTFTSAIVSSDGKEILTTTNDIKRAISGDYNDSFVVYNTKNGNIKFKMNSFGASAVAYSKDKKLFVLGVYPKPLVVNLETNSSLLLGEHDGLISSVEISGDKTLIATGGTDNKVRLFDSKTGKLIHCFEGHEGSINSLAFHPTKPILISGSSDGTIKYWDIKTKKLIVTFISFEDKWITLTPEGYFNASLDATKKLNILYDDMTIGSMKNLYDTFFRPDLVKLKLMGEDISRYTKDINLKNIIKNKPPTIEIAKINNYTDKEKVTVFFKVTQNDKGGVGLIRVYQEGKLIQTIGEGKIKKQVANIDIILEQEKLDKTMKKNQKLFIASMSKSVQGDACIEDTIAMVEPEKSTNKAGTYKIEVELKSGKNEISIEAFNKTNTITSYREKVTIHANIPKHKPKLYAIVAGVNEFESKSVNNLKYSQNDARDIKQELQNKMGSVFDKVEITYLLGKDVTKANILKAIQKISKVAKLEDSMLFYISTHGRAHRGKLYLVPQNNKNFRNWIDFEQTFKAIQSIKALNQIFIIDACESGEANDIVSSVYDSRASVLAKSSGVHMLLATTKGTSAFEHPDPNIKNGVFTYKILQAVEDNATDKNGDGFISVIELSKKLKEPKNNTNYQYPVIRNIGNDIYFRKIR